MADLLSARLPVNYTYPDNAGHGSCGVNSEMASAHSAQRCLPQQTGNTGTRLPQNIESQTLSSCRHLTHRGESGEKGYNLDGAISCWGRD